MSHYRPATQREIRRWSFGAVQRPRDRKASTWQAKRGTLDDEAIFGPTQDFQCACGKYQGEEYRGMICDRCGTKLTTRQVRRQRFGHLELPMPISHPLGSAGETISSLPVLPAAFWESPAGRSLAQRYDELAAACATPPRVGNGEQTLGCEVARLFELLLPAVEFAQAWNLVEAETLTRGLALIRQDQVE